MADAIEEVGRKKSQDEAMAAWAQMIYGNRPQEQGGVQEAAGCGGSSVPKETYQPQDPKKVSKLNEIKKAQEALKAEAARTQDTTVVKGAQPVQQAEQAVVPPRVEARQADAKVAQARQAQETEVKQTEAREEVREQAEVAQEEATEAATFQHPEIEMPATLGNTKEFADTRASAMANTGTKSPDQVDMAKEPEPVVEPDSAEQAALMAAIKGGAGANPDLIAKAYVNAAGMEGVKGTLQEGMLQGFVVAL